VAVFNRDGDLQDAMDANPIVTDDYGRFSATLPCGLYDLTISAFLGGEFDTYTIENVRVSPSNEPSFSLVIDNGGITGQLKFTPMGNLLHVAGQLNDVPAGLHVIFTGADLPEGCWTPLHSMRTTMVKTTDDTLGVCNWGGTVFQVSVTSPGDYLINFVTAVYSQPQA